MGNPHASPRTTFLAESKAILWQCIGLLKALEHRPDDASSISGLRHHFDNLCEPAELVGLSTLFVLAFDARGLLQQPLGLTPKRIKALEKACFYLLGVVSDNAEMRRFLGEEWAAPGLGLTEVDILAHDLKAPFGIIRSSAENVLAGRAPAPDAALQRIVRQATRGMQLIQNLLLPDKPRTDFQEHRLADILSSLREGWEAQASDKQVRVQLLFPADLRVRAHRVSLEQILENLLGNAIKFSPAAGRVDLQVETQRLPGTQQESLLFSIRDQGPGIPPETLPFVFLEGVRTGTQGHGLGLAICKKLCEAHGGTIWAESQPGVGTSLRFMLPV